MPKLLVRVGVGEVRNFPDKPFKQNDLDAARYFQPLPWYDEQGIPKDSQSYVEMLEVTELDDGTLDCALTRWDLWTDAEQAELKERLGSDRISRVKAYPEKPTARTHVEHFPVTSVDLLLAQFDDTEVPVP